MLLTGHPCNFILQLAVTYSEHPTGMKNVSHCPAIQSHSPTGWQDYTEASISIFTILDYDKSNNFLYKIKTGENLR